MQKTERNNWMEKKNAPPAAWWLFWGSLSVIVYTYIGFPLLTALRGWLRPRPLRLPLAGPAGGDQEGLFAPTVSFLIAAYNEAGGILKKIENALCSEYARGKIEIIVASDGSDDGTNLLVERLADPRVRLLALPRVGKNRAINQAVQAASGEILVFTDADSMLDPQALARLVAPFADPQVGGVGGAYHYVKNGAGMQGERTYWSFDRWLKVMQSQSGSITGTTGHIYAIRRSLFTPVPQGVTDDAYISRQVLAKHHRLVFEPQAVARGPIADTRGEFRRKVRVTTRGLNCIWQQRSLLNPFEYGYYSLQLFSHKVLRRLMAFPLLTLSVTAPMLWSRGWFYRLAALGQAGLHTAAAAGLLTRGTWSDARASGSKVSKTKLFSMPLYLDLVNAATLLAVWNLIRGQTYDVWSSEREHDS